MTVNGSVQNHACVGENIALTCDIEATSHIWRTSVTSTITAILPAFNPDDPLFTYSFSIKGDRNLISMATVVAAPEINGSIVSCGGPQQDFGFQNATILILGEYTEITSWV